MIDLPTELVPAAFVASRSIEFMNDKKAQPFFHTAAFWEPHHPALPSPEYTGIHDPAKIPEWDNFRDILEGKPNIQKRYSQQLHRRFTDADWDLWSIVIATHFDFMTMIDAQIGRMIDALKTLGLDKNTALFFTADHGDTLGCHGGQWDKGPYVFEETHRIPLIAKVPNVTTADSRTNSYATNMDLYSTILDICGGEIPEKTDALSLMPILKEPATQVRDCVIGQFNGFDLRGMHFQRMIVMDDYKYVYSPSDIDEFYDLKNDPAELTNLINTSSHSKQCQYLKKHLFAQMERSEDPFAYSTHQLMGL